MQDACGQLAFHVLEVGAAAYGAQQAEPFYALLDAFPESRIYAFEVDERACAELNEGARSGIRYFPVALGRTEEKRAFHRTAHPQCSSLYPPDEELLDHYLNMDMARLEEVSSIETTSLDRFAADQGIDDLDFIKIDIQGAELDVFQGGTGALCNVVMVVSEAEFVPHYIGQPLFGDVCAFLAQRKLMFHKFLGFGGRSLKPIVIGNNPNRPSQLLWSDSMFVRDIRHLDELTDEKLLKLGVLAFLYGSPDLAYRCIDRVDQRRRTGMGPRLLELIAHPG